MKAKELARLLLENPESEVLVIGNHGGWKKFDRKPRPISMFLLPGHDEYIQENPNALGTKVNCLIL